MSSMKSRIALLAVSSLVVLGACGSGPEKEGGVVVPAEASSSTTVPTSSASTASTAKVTTSSIAKATSTTQKVTTTTEKATTTTTRRVTPTTAAVSYANCSAVKAAGAAPIHRGEPGYSSKLDSDDDGVACEK